MIVLFLEHKKLNNNLFYIYNLFYYLKIKIQIINNITIYEYLDNNYDENDIYIFYEFFDVELFNLINLKYNKNIYYFINKIYNYQNLIVKYNKINFILVSNNNLNLINFDKKKLLLPYQFDINENYFIDKIDTFFIIEKNETIINYLNKYKKKYLIYNEENKYINRIIILDKILDEDEMNQIILNKNILLIKNNENLKYSFFYEVFKIYENHDELENIINNIDSLINNYMHDYDIYMKYQKKKLNINNKDFYQSIEKIEDINNNFGFIVLRNVINEKTNNYWYNNIKNIRKYYRNKIYIIDDNSDYKYIDINLKFEDISVIQSKFKQRGEILPYYYLYINKLFEKCLIIHDSVFINKYIDFNDYNEDIYYLWHFDHNSNNLKLEKNMINLLNNDIVDQKYDGKEWYGCFGVQSLIKYDFLEKIQKEFKIFNLLDYIDSRIKRMNFERIFSVLCTLLKSDLYINKSLFGNIKEYIKWDYTYEEYVNDLRNDKLDDHKLIKVWSGR